jgi:mRNA interferase MazF
MAYQRGDVVLVPFPFTDLSATRVRPAVIMSVGDYNAATDDVIVAMITGQERVGQTDCQLQDWRQAGLLAPSWARAKLATLEQRLIQLAPGKLSSRDTGAVELRVRRALGF